MLQHGVSNGTAVLRQQCHVGIALRGRCVAYAVAANVMERLRLPIFATDGTALRQMARDGE